METKTTNKTTTPSKPTDGCKQTVVLTKDGRLYINSNSGVIDPTGKSAVHVNGLFTISADSVRRLSAALQGKNYYVIKAPSAIMGGTIEVVTSDKAIKDKLEKVNALTDELAEARKNLKTAQNTLRLVKQYIEAQNQKRYPWERKIEIPE